MVFRKAPLFIFISVFFCSFINAQSTYYKAFDSVIGQNQTSLYNGLKYNNPYRAIPENHKFYLFHKFSKCDVVYDNQPFFDIDLKYDILNDVVIIQPKGDKSYIELQLISGQVSEFKIGSHHFYNLSQNEYLKALGYGGFFEKSYSGDVLGLYTKSVKKVTERIKGNKLAYSFEQYNYYFIESSNRIYEVSSKNSIKKLFPEKSTEINRFYKDYNSVLKSSPDDFMNRLIAYLDTYNSKPTE